jgi:hypothetical protein
MATTQRDRRTVETPTEARQAEPGPSVLALLAVSTGLAVLILGIVWFVFFRTWGNAPDTKPTTTASLKAFV